MLGDEPGQALALPPRRSDPWIGIVKPCQGCVQKLVSGRSVRTGALSPCLGGHLHRVPRAAERRSIAEIKLVQALNGHVVEEGCRENIDSLRNFRFPLPDQLSTEKPSSTFISADSKNDFLGARIVSFVIPKGGLNGKRIKPGFSSLFLAKTCARDCKLKYLDHLSTERPGKLCVATYRVLTGDTTLLVRSCSQGHEHRSINEAMPGLDTIPSSVNVWHTGLHRSVDTDGSLLTNFDASAFGEFRRRSNTYANKHEISRRFKSVRIANKQFSVLQFVDRLDLPSAE